VRGPKAVKWGLVDFSHPKSRFDERVRARLDELAKQSKSARKAPGIALEPVSAEDAPGKRTYRYVTLEVDDAARVATITMRAPDGSEPATPEALRKAGANAWVLRAWRELDDAILQLRLVNETVGVIVIKTAGDAAKVLEADRLLLEHDGDWLVREARLLVARVLRRIENTSKSLFGVVDQGSCFAGSLFELLLCCDRTFMLNESDAPNPIHVQVSALSDARLPMSHGLARLECRFLREPERAKAALATREPLDAETAEEMGLVTFAPDEIDWEDEVRIAIEERTSMSPDALTGMEQNLRFAGPESVETKVFGRLSAWQNWIFTRPNATGERGALNVYGKPARATFDWKRT
jgi:benzoyl-CoA-dihydrodiol lyase